MFTRIRAPALLYLIGRASVLFLKYRIVDLNIVRMRSDGKRGEKGIIFLLWLTKRIFMTKSQILYLAYRHSEFIYLTLSIENTNGKKK